MEAKKHWMEARGTIEHITPENANRLFDTSDFSTLMNAVKNFHMNIKNDYVTRH